MADDAETTSSNGLLCFKNCLLPTEDGKLVQKDLWVDERRGVILDAQRTFFLRRERPARTIDLEGNILSPGLLDIQINGAYGFDFSVYEGDDEAYRAGIRTVSEKIVETGVTSLVPTIITQQKSLYPTLLSLLRPFSQPSGATFLGWHAEGPFISPAKRGAHAPPFLLAARGGVADFEEVYGAPNLVDAEDWAIGKGKDGGVRIITGAPEVEGVMDAMSELARKGVVFSIGHSIATTAIAGAAVRRGARLITHLFNAMPQLHHRDPSIIGLLGSSPDPALVVLEAFPPAVLPSAAMSGMAHTKPQSKPQTPHNLSRAASGSHLAGGISARSEALDDQETPPQTPVLAAQHEQAQAGGLISPVKMKPGVEVLERPFYELIVDGVHSHPNSVRLAYSAYREGCILITDAMKILDPNLRDGVHEWRDGKRFVKEGEKLYLEGTDTLAGSVVTLDKCVRNFSRFTGCTLGEAIRCATFNPAKCLGIENRKGTLRPGADADLVVLDQSGHVLSTWIRGKQVWTRSPAT